MKLNMTKLKKIVCPNILFLTIIVWAFLHITGIGSYYFQEKKGLMIYRALHFLFLYVLFFNWYNLFQNRNSDNGKIAWKGFNYSLILLFVFLLLMWPGTWSWDDIFILNGASILNLTPWQHFFTGLFHILCLQTIPIPAGVIIIQIVIASMLNGVILSKIHKMYGKKILPIVFLILFFPPVLLYLLCGFRMGLYSLFELYLLINLLSCYYDEKKISVLSMIELCFFAIMVSTWRTEGIYYVVFFPLILLFLGNYKISKKRVFISFLIVLFVSLGIMKFNNYLIGNNNYSITSTMQPVTSLVKVADDNDKEELEIISKVLNINYILSHPEGNGEYYYWSGEVVKKYTEKEYKAYLKAYLKLALKHPKVVFRGMWNLFLDGGSGFGRNGIQTTRNMHFADNSTIRLFDKGNAANKTWSDNPSKYKSPISKKIRTKSILLLSGADSNYHINFIHVIFWNYMIPIILLLLSFGFYLWRKEYLRAILIFTIMVRIPLVFVTSPAPYFMYYLSVYLCGYVFSALAFYDFLFRKKTITKNPEKKQSRLQQFFHFFLVSGIGWCIDFSVYIILTSVFHFKVLYANILSSIPAITYVFFMSTNKIFKKQNSKYGLKTKYAIYFGYQLILLLVVSTMGEFLYEKLSDVITITVILNHLKILIKILITPFTMTLNFIVMKNLVEKL